jgi:hypothetical protein
MMRGLILTGATLLSLASCATPPAPSAGQKTIQGQSMARMLVTVDTIRAYTRGQATAAQANQAATELVSWSDRIGELFPPDKAPTLYVDMTPEMARGAPVAMHNTTSNLLAAVQSGSVPATTTALDRTEQDGCGFCHRAPYR